MCLEFISGTLFLFGIEESDIAIIQNSFECGAVEKLEILFVEIVIPKDVMVLES
jgi:hypothetical protein